MRSNVLLLILFVAISQLKQTCAEYHSLSSFSKGIQERLPSAYGDPQAIQIVNILAVLSARYKMNGDDVMRIIETAEEIVVISAERLDISLSELRRFKDGCHKIHQLEISLKKALHETASRGLSLQVRSLKGAIASLLNCELQALNEVKHELISGKSNLPNLDFVRERLRSCEKALLAAIKTLDILQNADSHEINTYIQSMLTSMKIPSKSEDKAMVKSLAKGSDDVHKADDFKFLRENFLVLAKSGVFFVLCAALKVYVCTFTFGALMISSSVLWVLNYLQFMNDEI